MGRPAVQQAEQRPGYGDPQGRAELRPHMSLDQATENQFLDNRTEDDDDQGEQRITQRMFLQILEFLVDPVIGRAVRRAQDGVDDVAGEIVDGEDRQGDLERRPWSDAF